MAQSASARTKINTARPPGDRAGVRDARLPARDRRGSRGGRCSPRTGSAGSGRVRQRRSWPPSWRRSGSGSRPRRGTWSGPSADLIRNYLDPDRLPVDERWSRKQPHTQRRLCERFAAPVIDAVTGQDIKTSHTQPIINAASTVGEGDRVTRSCRPISQPRNITHSLPAAANGPGNQSRG
jgi:hypothetical protein